MNIKHSAGYMSPADQESRGASGSPGEAGEESSGDASTSEDTAREMGWVPQEEFRGDPDKWITADSFVERGEKILPILKANNKRLRDDLLTRDRDLATLRTQVSESQKILKTLQSAYEESTKAEVDKAKDALKLELREAKVSGDVDLELEIQDKLESLKTPKKVAVPSTQEQVISEPLKQWGEENPWYGGNSREDQKKTQEFLWSCEDLRKEGSVKIGTDFLQEALLRYQKTNVGSVSKVEGGNSGGRVSSGRKFSQLSSQAKEVCHSDSHRFVGPGKMFKNLPEYEDHWASLYAG